MEKKYKITIIILIIIIIGLIGFIIIGNNKKENKKCEEKTCECNTTIIQKEEETNIETKEKEEPKETNKKEIKRDENGEIIREDYYNNGKVGHSNNKYAGLYYAEKDVIAPEEKKNSKYNKVYFNLYLSDDGTFIYNTAMYIGFGYLGNYIIEGDQIILNVLFKGGHEPTLAPYFYTTTLKIESENTLLDTNIVEYSENIGTKEVKLERNYDEKRNENYKNEFRFMLERFKYLNDSIL